MSGSSDSYAEKLDLILKRTAQPCEIKRSVGECEIVADGKRVGYGTNAAEAIDDAYKRIVSPEVNTREPGTVCVIEEDENTALVERPDGGRVRVPSRAAVDRMIPGAKA